MKLWHRFLAWNLSRKVRREHQQLSKYVRRHAYEIAAWHHDIAFLEHQLERHLALAGLRKANEHPVRETASNKVVSLGKGALDLLVENRFAGAGNS